jgi:hypothetical protein
LPRIARRAFRTGLFARLLPLFAGLRTVGLAGRIGKRRSRRRAYEKERDEEPTHDSDLSPDLPWEVRLLR